MDVPATGADRISAGVVNLPSGWRRADSGVASRISRVLAGDRVPRRGDGSERRLLAAWVWPAQWLAVCLERRGWYLHAPTGTAFGLRRSKAQAPGVLVALYVVVFVVVLRLTRTALGWALLAPVYAVMLYSLSVGVLLWLAHRQQRSGVGRRGRLRQPPDVPQEAPALLVSGWHPSREAGADPAAEQAVRELLPVIAVRRPVHARAMSLREDERLRSVGLVDVPGHFGLFVWRPGTQD